MALKVKRVFVNLRHFSNYGGRRHALRYRKHARTCSTNKQKASAYRRPFLHEKAHKISSHFRMNPDHISTCAHDTPSHVKAENDEGVPMSNRAEGEHSTPETKALLGSAQFEASCCTAGDQATGGPCFASNDSGRPEAG